MHFPYVRSGQLNQPWPTQKAEFVKKIFPENLLHLIPFFCNFKTPPDFMPSFFRPVHFSEIKAFRLRTPNRRDVAVAGAALVPWHTTPPLVGRLLRTRPVFGTPTALALPFRSSATLTRTCFNGVVQCQKLFNAQFSIGGNPNLVVSRSHYNCVTCMPLNKTSQSG